MTAESMIDYEALAQEAMRNVVRSVLAETAEKGLPGDHHFYISFDTLASGVILSKRLREKYTEEMTIVLQHRFWDLIVNDARFEVKLTFDGIPERLVIPFKAIKVFFDPSVRYGLQFESVALEAVNEPLDADVDLTGLPETDLPEPPRALGAARATKAPTQKRTPSKVNRPTVVTSGEDGTEERDETATALTAELTDSPELDEEVLVEDEADTSEGAEIVSLDAFRKK